MRAAQAEESAHLDASELHDVVVERVVPLAHAQHARGRTGRRARGIDPKHVLRHEREDRRRLGGVRDARRRVDDELALVRAEA